MTFITIDECRRIRDLARKGHSYTAIGRCLLDRRRRPEAVSYHARGKCDHGDGHAKPVDPEDHVWTEDTHIERTKTV